MTSLSARSHQRDWIDPEASGAAPPKLPPISVIVPVRNDPLHLTACLEAIGRTRSVEYEVIVVDDASSDRASIEVAESFGARVVQLEEQGGPGRARNLGVQQARHDIVFFVDADVCLRPESLLFVSSAFANDPEIDALFGSYDTQPLARNLLSQYRNLMHHYVHQTARSEASTFWSGCGAVRRGVFLESGGFDASYERPSIEDIELGARLKAAGRRIVVVKSLQVTHLKRWTMFGLVWGDVRDRAVPWTMLLLETRSIPNDLNLKYSQRLSAFLSLLLVAVMGIGVVFLKSLLLIPLLAFVGFLGLDRWSHHRRLPDLVRGLAVVLLLASVAATVYLGLRSPPLWQLWLLTSVGLVAAIFAINFRFYRFFARSKGWLFVPIVLPLHILYFVYSSVGLALGTLAYLLGGRSKTSSG